MTVKSVSSLAVVLSAIIVAVLLGNIYYFYPRQVLKLPKAKLLAPDKNVNQQMNPDINATTLEKIRSPNAKVGLPGRSNPFRNPFLWPEETATHAPKPKKVVFRRKSIEKPRLRMVIIGERRKVALLNDTLVLEGMFFKNHKVKEIDKTGVTLITEDGEMKISLYE